MLAGTRSESVSVAAPAYVGLTGAPASFDLTCLISEGRAASQPVAQVEEWRRLLKHADVTQPGSFPAGALKQLTSLDSAQCQALQVGSL